MGPEAALQKTESERPHPCPACGVPYATHEDDEGCPVCLLRRAMQPEARVQDLPDEGRFDHYEIVRRDDGRFDELGRGAMGVTYRALDTVLGHAVALKVIDARIAKSRDARERFLREARAAARLRHPNIASVFYYGVRKSDGQCFYAMELVEGETLEALLRREGSLSAPFALSVVAQVARAMALAESHGLVHRDLKPANLMLVSGPDLAVKIIDFGLAKAAAPASESDITHGAFVGTPAFASPEQVRGAEVDIRSDLYSLGVIAWQILAGKAPFRGSPAEVMYQHQHASLPIEQLKDVPQPVALLLQMLLQKDPSRRFNGPAELLKAIPTIIGALDARRRITRRSLQKKSPANSLLGICRPRVRPGPKKVSIARLPITGSDVFGRDEDIAFLDRAWANQDINIVTIVAWAGVGKSTLVNHWLRRMATDHYRSAELIFGWSFYRQGSSRQISSAAEFLDAALAWFGDRNPRLGTAWEKGERLAKLVAHRRSLLILDGLEPIQNAPGPLEGRLREPSLQALLRELAAFNRGLCVITTRTPVTDIADHERTSALRCNLEQLSSDAGAKLLRALGVKGDEAELRSASNEFSGHCLGLTLLGSYLTDAYDGDIRFRREVSQRLAHDVRQGVHARKVMESYETWLGEGPELSVLRMFGLFDRPADQKAFAALLKPPAIRGLTDSLIDLSPTEWRTILAKLRRAKLLAGEDPHNPGHLDTHPLVREYYGGQLRSQRTEAWKECNRRLHDYYRALAPQRPDSFGEMEPLFLAVICGCNAGLCRDALQAIYIPRIQRGNAFFAANVLGARETLLWVIAHFFEHGRWGSPIETAVEGQSLTADDQLFLLMQAGLYLSATQGSGAPELRICFERAESLCHSLNRPLLLYVALIGQWRHSLVTDKLSATMQIAKRVYSLAQEQNEPALMIGAYRALASTLYFLGDFETARQYAMRGVQIWRSGGVRSPVEEVVSPAVSCLYFLALSEWQLGESASCHANMAEAILLAKELNDTHQLALALYFAAGLAQFERNPAEVERLASDLIALSTRHNFGYFLAATGAAILRGWARSASGHTVEGLSEIEHGIENYRAYGPAIPTVPLWLALKAEALHLANRSSEALEIIREAVALGERSEERWWHAELYRLRGVFLAAIGAAEAQIEASFCAAIKIAREQKSVSLARRAEASYTEFLGQKAGGRVRFPLGYPGCSPPLTVIAGSSKMTAG
jgi:serine/threonine protein kinase/tetratricopeptide (TPR) repeat protein